MTRKDYINIAAAIQATQARISGEYERMRRDERSFAKEACSPVKERDELRGVRRAAAHLADFLKDDNPRFDPARFLSACGYGATEVGAAVHEHIESKLQDANHERDIEIASNRFA